IRFTTTGTLDTSFASSGIFDLPSVDVQSAEPMSDGKLLDAGIDTQSSASYRVLRLSAAGVIDNTFGAAADGISSASVNFGIFHSPVPLQTLITPDDKILLFENTALVKLSPFGQVDQTFGRVITFNAR